jgi:diaminopimelate epimerase
MNNQEIAKLCRQHYSIGADGLIMVEKIHGHYKMTYFNHDGSRASMCGNGLRCAAKYIYDNDSSKNTKMKIQSDVLLHSCEIISDKLVKVEMGSPDLNHKNIKIKNLPNLKVADQNISLNYYFMTTDHIVLDCSKLKISQEDMIMIGKKLMKSDFLVNGSNTNFITSKDNETIQITTFERGVGITNACGSGACAVAWHISKGKKGDYKINQKGGTLEIQIINGKIHMTGPVKYVFKGEM